MENISNFQIDKLSDIKYLDKLAILQLIYQLIVSSDGQVIDYRDDKAIDYALLVLCCTNFEWNYAISNTDPFESFDRISILSPNLKKDFIELLNTIALAGGNQRARKDIARQIQQRIQ